MAVNHQLTTSISDGCTVAHFNASGGLDVHWKVFLWPSRDMFHGKMADGVGADGLHHPHPYRKHIVTRKRRPMRVVGSIHFVRDKWDMEVVAHECLHAIAHYIRSTGKNPLGDKCDNMKEEEELCYPFGRLVEEVYTKLWELNPSPGWVKKKEE